MCVWGGGGGGGGGGGEGDKNNLEFILGKGTENTRSEVA